MTAVFIVIMSIQVSEFCAAMMAENGGLCRIMSQLWRVFVMLLPVHFSEFCALMVAENGGFCRNYGAFSDRFSLCPLCPLW